MRILAMSLAMLILTACGAELNKVRESKQCTASGNVYQYKIFESGKAVAQFTVNGTQNTCIFEDASYAEHVDYHCESQGVYINRAEALSTMSCSEFSF